ncbi:MULTISPECIES: hypothetical protein [unclassified Bradyrhizobium]
MSDGPPLIPNPSCPRDWRLNREARFTWKQQRRREWISFREIVEEWLPEIDGHETVRANARDILLRDLLAGDFEEHGRSKVLYLHFRTRMARMKRQHLLTIIDTSPPDVVWSEYLARCWFPRSMFHHWLAKHELPRNPARFEPREEATEHALMKPPSMPKGKDSAKPELRRGRPSTYDWPEIKRFIFEQLDTRGDFAEEDQVDDWKTCADLYRAIEEKFGEKCPALTTLKERVPGLVDEWRAQKGQ